MWTYLASLAVLAPAANALLRFPCSQLVTQRLDPYACLALSEGFLLTQH